MSEFSIGVIFIALYLLKTISFKINLRNIIVQVGFIHIGLKSITYVLIKLWYIYKNIILENVA